MQAIVIMLFSVLSLLTKAPAEHALYLSVIDIEIFDQEVKTTIKVFSDDLNNALRNVNSQLVSTELIPNYKEVEAYFNDKILLRSEGNIIAFEVKSISIEGESTFVNLVTTLPKLAEDISIEAGYFYELFPTQQNIVKANWDGKQQFFMIKSAQQTEHLRR